MEHQFETLESAHDFVKLLVETVAEAKRDLENDVQRESLPSRRLDALRVALYNMTKLEIHVSQTSRLLNDLRTLRRLLFEERQVVESTGFRAANYREHSRNDRRSERRSGGRRDRHVGRHVKT